MTTKALIPAYFPFTGVSILEIVFCVFVAENNFVKKLIPTYFPFIGVRLVK